MSLPAKKAGLGNFITTYRYALISVGIFSAVVNLLMLTGPVFMLQVYDRVLASQSVPTLLMLVLLVALLLAFYAILEVIRTRILCRVAADADAHISKRVFEQVAYHSSHGSSDRISGSPSRDLDTLRQFMSGPAPLAFFDMPWLPVFLAIVFMMHVWLGLTALAGAFVLCVLAVANEMSMRAPRKNAATCLAEKQRFFSFLQRNGDVARAMGMVRPMADNWQVNHRAAVLLQSQLSDTSGAFSASIKGIRLFLQSLILGVGAYLAIHQQVSPGAMIAASIIAARALAPLEAAVANWRQYGDAFQAFKRLQTLLADGADQTFDMALPSPKSDLSLEGVQFCPAARKQPVLQGIDFSLQPGNGLAVLGPSAAGKSTLARLLVGLIPEHDGDIRLDGATLDQWHPDRLGQFLGYVPQKVILFPGTIAQNISRFTEEIDPAKTIAAAKAAGVHELILGLPDGYETRCDEQSFSLSVGQQQRIALARALYGDPFLIVLDEPNSSLDADGENALISAIRSARKRGAIVVVMAHRPSILAAVDRVLMLYQGRQHAFGDKEKVLPNLLRPANEGRDVA